MALIQWDESFSVHVQEIDNQHKALIKMINDYYDAVLRKELREGLAQLLQSLETYTIRHFETEERYFDRYGYEDAAEHKKRHATLRRQVREFRERVNGEKIVLPFEIGKFMTDWLTNHIKKDDRRYSRCFNEHGLR